LSLASGGLLEMDGFGLFGAVLWGWFWGRFEG